MNVVRRRASTAVALAVLGGLSSSLMTDVAGASTPPSPPPYPHIELQGSGPPDVTCVDAAGGSVYVGPAWTLEPLLRGPLFAPTVVFFSGVGAENRLVAPLRFRSTAYPIVWSTVDGRKPLSGTVESIAGRPVGYGPLATSNEPMVTCSYSLLGHEDFGTFRITPGLQSALGLPRRTIGRTVAFDGEGDVTFEVRQNQFPLILENYDPAVQPWQVVDTPPFPWVDLPRVTCARGRRVVYRGPATTLAPVVRGLDWAPMAFWLRHDRIVTPHWSRLTIEATWETVGGDLPLSGTIAKDASFAPSGVGPNPYPGAAIVDCSWKVRHDDPLFVTPELAVQLELSNRTIGRDIHLVGSAVVHAYVPDWLFPPR